MPNLDVKIRLNLEGHWPRETYRQLCAERGVAYDEADYLRWRAVGERLTGEPCFETTVERASVALRSLGIAVASLEPHMRRAMERA